MSPSWSAAERADLAQTLGDLGPGRPTLCEGWQTQHLAAHLVLRDRRPWAMSPARLERTAASAQDRAAYDELVAQVAAGPGVLAPGHWAGEQMNLLEFYVHTQDAVRATPGARADDLDPAHAAALWSQLRHFARLLYRPSSAGVILAVDDGPRVVVRRPRRGHGSVVVSGPVPELVLHAFGRGGAAEVELLGSATDLAALSEHFPAPRPRPTPSRP